jgi:hypothetical protein
MREPFFLVCALCYVLNSIAAQTCKDKVEALLQSPQLRVSRNNGYSSRRENFIDMIIELIREVESLKENYCDQKKNLVCQVELETLLHLKNLAKAKKPQYIYEAVRQTVQSVLSYCFLGRQEIPMLDKVDENRPYACFKAIESAQTALSIPLRDKQQMLWQIDVGSFIFRQRFMGDPNCVMYERLDCVYSGVGVERIFERTVELEDLSFDEIVHYRTLMLSRIKQHVLLCGRRISDSKRFMDCGKSLQEIVRLFNQDDWGFFSEDDKMRMLQSQMPFIHDYVTCMSEASEFFEDGFCRSLAVSFMEMFAKETENPSRNNLDNLQESLQLIFEECSNSIY